MLILLSQLCFCSLKNQQLLPISKKLTLPQQKKSFKASTTKSVVVLPTTHVKNMPLIEQLKTEENPIINEIPAAGGQDSYFLKGLESRHTAYYWGDIPISTTLKSCAAHLDKLPTMVRKGTGLGGALIYALPQQKFQNTTGFSTNGGIEQRTNIHTKKNNHFFSGVFSYNNDGRWNTTPSHYDRQSIIKDRVGFLEGAFETGHEDAEQKFSISSVNQYVKNTYDNIYDRTTPFREEKCESFFNLFGASHTRKNWHSFASLHTTKTRVTNYPDSKNITLTAGLDKTEDNYHFGTFTQQLNNHKIYRYDIYGGRRIGPLYPTARLIRTERQFLCPFEITTELGKSVKVICGSAYHLPNEFQRLDPQYGNFDLRPEHNYHCHIIHNWQTLNWTVEQTVFANHITDLIDLESATDVNFNKSGKKYQNYGTLDSIGISQSIDYEGFERYKVGVSHTCCALSGSKPLLSRSAWKASLQQRFYLSESCFVDLNTHFSGNYFSGDRLNYSELRQMPHNFLFDLSSTHILNKNWTVLCEVKNLTNHHYENPHGYVGKGIETWIKLVYTV